MLGSFQNIQKQTVFAENFLYNKLLGISTFGIYILTTLYKKKKTPLEKVINIWENLHIQFNILVEYFYVSEMKCQSMSSVTLQNESRTQKLEQ